MRKVLAIAVLAAVGFGAAASQAVEAGGPQELPNSCLFIGGGQSSGDGTEVCTFEAAEVPAHGFIGATPNDILIFRDDNANGIQDGEEPTLAEASPTGFEAPGGTFTAAAGDTITVHLSHGCGGPVCGWIGTLLVG